MAAAPGAPRWIDAAGADRWLDRATDWLDAGLARAGLERTGPLATVKHAPWSLVVRVPTSGGPAWFKADAPALRAEAALLGRLAELAPGSVPRPLALDEADGWLLLADHGPTLRTLGRDTDPAVWAEVVGQWSALARGLAGRAGELARLGVPRLAPADAAGYLIGRTAELAGLPAADPGHLPPATADQLTGVVPALTAAGDRLAALGLPLTLWHNDLHTNNVFGPDGRGRLVFFDLGDALLGHPLAELLIPLRAAAHARGVDPGDRSALVADPALRPVIEAALEPWTDLATPKALRRAVPDALLLGVLGRSEGWRRALASADEEGRSEYGEAGTAWLLELLDG